MTLSIVLRRPGQASLGLELEVNELRALALSQDHDRKITAGRHHRTNVWMDTLKQIREFPVPPITEIIGDQGNRAKQGDAATVGLEQVHVFVAAKQGRDRTEERKHRIGLGSEQNPAKADDMERDQDGEPF